MLGGRGMVLRSKEQPETGDCAENYMFVFKTLRDSSSR